jgi:DNA-binding transcriptional regulator YhcF (GntR family)
MVDNAKMPAPGSPQTELTTLAVDRDAEVPIGVQLAWALRTRIADGEFKPGQRLPGLRDLAEVIGVNLNTVRTVYQRLEHEGLIESQQGSGTFVAPTSALGSAVGTIAASAARAARETGVDPREVAAALYVAPEPPALSSEEAADLSEVGQRQLLRRQIAAFESALAEIEAANPGVAPAPAAEPKDLVSGPALLGTHELEQVRTALVRRLAAVQAAIDEQNRADAGQPPPAAPRRARKPAAPLADAAESPKRTRRPRATVRTLPAGT